MKRCPCHAPLTSVASLKRRKKLTAEYIYRKSLGTTTRTGGRSSWGDQSQRPEAARARLGVATMQNDAVPAAPALPSEVSGDMTRRRHTEAALSLSRATNLGGQPCHNNANHLPVGARLAHGVPPSCSAGAPARQLPELVVALVPCDARSVLMHADDGGVDHLDSGITGSDKCIVSGKETPSSGVGERSAIGC